MPLSAPLRIPVELKLQNGRVRWFRMAHAVSEEGMLLGVALPGECEGPLSVVFLLPDDELPFELIGRVFEVPVDDAHEHERRRGLAFIRPDEESRARIARYVELRLQE